MMSIRKEWDSTGSFGRVPPRFSLSARLLLAIGLVCASVAAGRDALANGIESDEIECLALTIYFEARGEPDEGKLAVGHVVMNRMSHPLFPEEVCKVVRQGGEKVRYRCQFTWWCDGRSDTPTNARVWDRIKSLASRVYQRSVPDPTEGALWYHTVDVKPVWRHQLVEGPRIGRHVFYHGAEAAQAKGSEISRAAPNSLVQDPVLLVPTGIRGEALTRNRRADASAVTAARPGKASWQGPISACRWC